MNEPHRGVCSEAGPTMGFSAPNPLRQRVWTDEQGVEWRKRGDGVLSAKRARHLFRQSDVLLIHLYDGDPHVHTDLDRDGLIAEVEQVWRGAEDDPNHGFEAGEFRNEAGQPMVLVVEHC